MYVYSSALFRGRGSMRVRRVSSRAGSDQHKGAAIAARGGHVDMQIVVDGIPDNTYYSDSFLRDGSEVIRKKYARELGRPGRILATGS